MPTCPKCWFIWKDEQKIKAGKARWSNVSKANRRKAMSNIAKMAKGVPKNFSADELERRRKRMAAINKKRRVKAREAKAANTEVSEGGPLTEK